VRRLRRKRNKGIRRRNKREDGKQRRRKVAVVKNEVNIGGEEGGDDRLCGLVVRVPGYRFGDPGSIPGATRLPEK
jgi:hypothetical protein